MNNNNAKATPTGDIILIDWFSCTFPTIYNELDMLKILGLSPDLQWELKPGHYGYKHKLEYCNMKIMWDHPVNNGCYVEFTGHGCRVFETYSHVYVGMLDLIKHVELLPHHYSRLDPAFDDHSGLFNIYQFRKDCEQGNVMHSSRDIEIQFKVSSPGLTIYFGTEKSEVLIRIYDKAAEQKVDEHWNRIEIQLRNSKANAFATELAKGVPVGQLFKGFLYDHIKVKVPSKTDSNKSRWDDKKYWLKVVDKAESIKLVSTADVSYNLSNLRYYVHNICGKPIRTLMAIDGDLSVYMDIKDKYDISDLSGRQRFLIEHNKELHD